MIKWKKLYKNEIDLLIEEWDISKKSSSLIDVMRTKAETTCSKNNDSYKHYAKLRDCIVETYNYYRNEKKLSGYQLDIKVGAVLFFILRKFDFTVRQAADKAIWSYISYCILPDITQDRWKSKDSPECVARDHFDKKISRNYFRSLWWYYYLGLVDDTDTFFLWTNQETINNCIKETHKMLTSPGLSTDTIVSIVERSGTDGYRVILCRKILHYLCKMETKDTELLRRVMVKNTFLLAVIEPEFVPAGMDGYVANLFDSVKRN